MALVCRRFNSYDNYRMLFLAIISVWIRNMENAVETLVSQKEELSSSMDSSDHGTMVQREMMKIRKEGKMKENCVTDTHKIIYEAEKRVGKKKKDTEKYTKDK